MGNDPSKNGGSKYGGIYVHFDKPVYSPTETATGTINLNLVQQYPGTQLYITLKGVEYTRWIQRVRKTSRRTSGRTGRRRGGRRKGRVSHHYVRVPRSAKLETINEEFPIHTWTQTQGYIPPGQYSFPFAFMVPKGLPGSFYFERGTSQGSIRYIIKGMLASTDRNVPIVKHERDIVIRENLYQQIQTREVLIDKNIKSCCCCSKGRLNIKTHFEKNAYAPGETARMITEIDNSQCSSAISSLKFQLVQNIHLQAHAHRKTIPTVICSDGLGRVAGGAQKEVKESSIKLPPGQEGKVIEYQINDQGEVDENDDESALVSKITPSVNGYLVKSNFVLKLKTEIDACICCDVSPEALLPIQVYSVSLLQEPQPYVANWQPVQMPVSNLSVNMLSVPADYQLLQYDSYGNMINGNMMMDYNQMQQQGFQNYGENTYAPNQVVPQYQPTGNNSEMVDFHQYPQ